MSIPQALRLALQHHQAGRLPEAENLYRHVLATEPGNADALHLLGVVAHQAGRDDLATDWIGQAIAARPNFAEAHNSLGSVLTSRGRLEESIAAFRSAITIKPDYMEAHFNLGNALAHEGRLDEAIATYRHAIALNEDEPDAQGNLGIALWRNGEREEAITVLRRVVALRPNHPESHYNLGIALGETGQLDDAIDAFRQAVALKPGYQKALCNLGNALKNNGQLDEAILVHRRAIALAPDDPFAHSNLGNALHDRGRIDDAITAYRKAAVLKPDLSEAHSNLGNALKDAGLLDEAIAAYRQATVLKPEFPEAHSNIVYALQSYPGIDGQALVDDHHLWNQRHAEPLRRFIQPHSNERTLSRRLRLGYVSPDFRLHSVAYFLEAVLACHDREEVEVFCYSNLQRSDAVTLRLRGMVSGWRDIFWLSDADVTELVRKDGIDILMDLTGHTANNRLTVFARKPAPVQVSWLGYPDSTGMKAMDYRLTDALADPLGMTEHFYSEKLFRLPECAWCFSPSSDAPPVNDLPFSRSGHFTFCSFNAQHKINLPLVKLWSRVLDAVPDSRLLLKNSSIENASIRGRLCSAFSEAGIAPERIVVAPYAPTLGEHLAAYGHADIALDTFPYHGATTTCEALWMGVPVVSLAGKRHASRVGVSLLSNVGLPELIARSEEQYIQIAVQLAKDVPRMQSLRTNLRKRMQSSPLTDAARFTREMEMAYREMWRKCCEAAG